MNHKFLSYLTPAFMAIAMGLGFAACSEDAFDSGSESEGQITITLSSSKVASRATTPGEDTLNENYIGETHLYFYPKGSGENAAPVFEHYVDPNATSSATVTLLMKQAKELFGDTGTECEVYALTNLPDGTVIPDDHSRQALRNVAITSPFESTAAQTSFVMDGEGIITLDRANQTAKGTVSLVRSAAKIILSVNVKAEIVENGATWRSNRANMFVSFANGVKKSVVDKKTDDTFTAPSFDTDMFSIPINTESGHKFTDTGVTGEGVYPYVQTIPFYTYPNKCTDATNADANHPYLTLMVQWQNQTEAGAEAQYCYYQIPIGKHGDMKLDRNNIYRINLNVSKLGSFVEIEAVELDMSYEVVNWSSVATDVDIEDYRYLVLNQTEYTMNNENEITIPFYSSHEITDVEVELTYWRYNVNTNGDPVERKVTVEANNKSQSDDNDKIFTLNIDNQNKTIYFKHDLSKTWLNSDYSEDDPSQGTFVANLNEAAYSPYKMKFTIHHSDISKEDSRYEIYSKEIIINQYPAMYIQVEPSTETSRIINDNWWSTSNNGATYTARYVNDKWGNNRQIAILAGNQPTTQTPYYLGRTSKGTGYNQNFNNYTVTVTKLTDGTYTIADPRQDKINNTLTTMLNDDNSIYEDESQVALWSVPGVSMDDLTTNDYIYTNDKTKRLLAYYYPTDERYDKRYFIAPSYTVASSYSTTLAVTKEGARRRCASYQENGRPAGRWRLPTVGEVKYIMDLSSSGKIPYLFGNMNNTSSNMSYWTSYGYVTVNIDHKTATEGNESTKTTSNVRCVYDEWYWKDRCGEKPFTWGDRPYSDPEIESSTNP